MSADTTAGGLGSVPKEVLAFYYPWYGDPAVDKAWTHWQPDATGLAATNITGTPSDGLYSSHNPAEVAHQIAEAQQAGLTGFISSWWGPGNFTDQAMPILLAAATQAGFSVTAYVDTGAITGTTETELVASATADLEYLVGHYASSPAWLSVDGKPVVFIYSSAANKLSAADWKGVLATVDAATPSGLVAIGPGGAQWAGVFQGGHDYTEAGLLQGKSPAQAATLSARHDASMVAAEQAAGEITTATVIPGFDNSHDSGESLLVDDRAGGQLYAAQWQAAIAANPDWVLVSTFNEWHEGTEIEPSVQYGSSYLAQTARYAAQFLPVATAPAGVTPAALAGVAPAPQPGMVVVTPSGATTVVRDVAGAREAITSLGADTIYTGADADTVYAAGPSVLVQGGGGTLVFVGGPGTDQVDAGAGRATLWGGAGACTLKGGTGGANVLVAGAGNSSLVGAAGDVMFGGPGATTFAGSPGGGDIMVGGSGPNAFGLTAGDVAFGGTGANSFGTGAAGPDAAPAIVVTGAGSNDIVFGPGGAIVFGAAGSDTYTVVEGVGGLDVVSGFKAGDSIRLDGFAVDAQQVLASASTGAWGTTLALADGTRLVLLSVSGLDPAQLGG